METRLYAVYDRVAEESSPVFSSVNDGVALRQFKRLMSDVSPLDRGEYKLFFIATFNLSTMKMTLEVMPVEVEAFFGKETPNETLVSEGR